MATASAIGYVIPVDSEIEAREKFAIVGVGCRMPPGAYSLTAFWKFLLRGGNASKALKKDRWDWRQYFDEDQQRPGKSYAAKASYLDADIRQFDPLAFGMSPREAESLDPQQRLLLESSWEAFEDAGLPLEKMSGSSTGVFIGGFCLDHMVMQAQPSNRHLVNAHSAGGVMMTVLSNRISHAFNLRGPSLTLDTACSSSLVALHYACQSLRLRECDMALAGGVNVMTRPDFPIIMSKGHFLSPHGECHTFDETAAGYGRGEGAGVLLLKRLSDALAAGDLIHAVVRASGVNQDGHTDGISLPNSQAQEALIRQVYRQADLPMAEVDYVEAHGTGTQAGDSAELGALHRTFSEGRTRKLVVGSVKSNIGHLEAAAGVAGVLKAIGILKHRQVPKNLHFKNPNPKIPFAEYCVEVAKDTKPLPSAAEKATLYAAVNSFGYGGTNAHVLLESAPVTPPPPSASETGDLRVIPFSAQSDKALRDLAGKFAFQLGQGFPGTLADFAHTAAFRRSHLNYRGAAVAANVEQLRAQFIAASTGETHEGLVLGSGAAEPGAGLVFVYTGMGPQWWGMGQELLKTQPIVSATLDEIDVVFQPLAGWSLKEAMLAPEASSRMERTELAQPANFALQVALTRLWASYGIHPVAVVGHSVGEVASAYVAGVYTLEDAVKVSFYRSRLQQTMAGQGSMLAMGLPEAEAEKLLAGSPGVSIAAINSFNAVTLSGDTAQLKAIASGLEARGVFNKFLRVEVAYHSPQMEPLRQPILEALSTLSPRPARLPLYSTGYGHVIPAEDWTAEYWWHNVRQPVRFAAAMQALFAEEYSSFLEVGPHPVLGNSIKECAAHLERKVRCFVSLRRAEPELPRLLLTAGELYCAGYTPDWSHLAPASGRFLPGPQYPWQRETLWLESERSKMERLGLPGPVYLNRSIIALNPTWEVEINRNYFPFLFDHGVQDQTVFAGMGYIESAISLSQSVLQKPAMVLENVSFERVLVIDYSKLQYLVSEFDAPSGRFNIGSRVEGEERSNTRHCRGRIFPLAEPQPSSVDLAAFRTECSEAVTAEDFYARLRQRQLFYGPTFQSAVELSRSERSFILKINSSAAVGEETHPLHPCIFDAALQAVIYCASGDELFVPFAFEQFHYFSSPDPADCYAVGRILSQTETQIVADVWLASAEGVVHAHARHLALQVISLAGAKDEEPIFYEPRWDSAPLEEPTPAFTGDGVLLLADAADSDLALAKSLASLLPAAALSLEEASESGGFVQDTIALRLAAYPDRSHIVVLWGSGEAQSDLSSISRLNEKFIGLLKVLGAKPSAGTEVTLVTRGAASPGGAVVNLCASSLSGIGLTAQNEYDTLSFRSLDLDASSSAEQVIAELAGGRRGEIAIREAQRLEKVIVAREEDQADVQMTSSSLEEPLELRQGLKGSIGSLFFQKAERRDPAEGEVEIRLHRVALNEKDLLKIEGRVHPVEIEGTFWGADLGMECSGVVVRSGPNSRFSPGQRVVALLPRAFRTYATLPEACVVSAPESLGFEAAAIPVVYLAAYRALVELARLEQGERILIHHATGGLGIAALSLARWLGAEVYATAGSEEKRQWLRDQGVAHVFSSRDLDFAARIPLVLGAHQGIDVVLGARSAPARNASLGLLRTGGRYIEVGKKDIAEDLDLPLRPFHRNLMFASVDVDRLAQERPAWIQKTLASVLGHFASGALPVPPIRLFPASAIREAFTEMREGRHLGKFLVDFSEGEVEVVAEPGSDSPIKRDGAYLITGGTSGFGLATARWIASQGGGKVVLVSRSGRKAPGIDAAVEEIEKLGAQVDVVAVDVIDAKEVKVLIDKASASPFVLRGVIHGAMVLDDVFMEDLTEERFRKVFLPKVAGALNLSEALAQHGLLDFLVFYSSISALIGNPGQTNYVAANSLLDHLAHTLRSRGLPALSINWGALAESGVVARDERISSALAASGITGLSNQRALEALDQALRLPVPQWGIFQLDWEKWLAANPRLADDPRFREQRMRSSQHGGDDTTSRVRSELAGLSKEQRLRALEDRLQDVLAKTLKMSKDAVSMTRKLNEMGVDSLMVLELSLGIKECIGLSFSAMEFLKGPNLQQLAVLAESRLWSN